jgi:hypothetical protein
MDYKTKYLKYKEKYLTLKKQLGGTSEERGFNYNGETFSFTIDTTESPLTLMKLYKIIKETADISSPYGILITYNNEKLTSENFKDHNYIKGEYYNVYQKLPGTYYTITYNGKRDGFSIPRGTRLTFETLQEKIKDLAKLDITEQIIKNYKNEIITKENFDVNSDEETTYTVSKK